MFLVALRKENLFVYNEKARMRLGVVQKPPNRGRGPMEPPRTNSVTLGYGVRGNHVAIRVPNTCLLPKIGLAIGDWDFITFFLDFLGFR